MFSCDFMMVFESLQTAGFLRAGAPILLTCDGARSPQPNSSVMVNSFDAIITSFIHFHVSFTGLLFLQEHIFSRGQFRLLKNMDCNLISATTSDAISACLLRLRFLRILLIR